MKPRGTGPASLSRVKGVEALVSISPAVGLRPRSVRAPPSWVSSGRLGGAGVRRDRETCPRGAPDRPYRSDLSQGRAEMTSLRRSWWPPILLCLWAQMGGVWVAASPTLTHSTPTPDLLALTQDFWHWKTQDYPQFATQQCLSMPKLYAGEADEQIKDCLTGEAKMAATIGRGG
ncbi:uncharacterized protein LOC134776085 [Penaeus indicus]|uniref:uncharacterized protein LOC134776085 n=1 Tax=Penaeus indicus TaxID=29960 RepID=UPI00300C6D43